MRYWLSLAVLFSLFFLMGNATAIEKPFIIPRTGEYVAAPTSDTEALRILDFQDARLTHVMQGLYRTYRAQGKEIIEALMMALKDLAKAVEANHPKID
jgi:hypothetical protein